MKFSILMPVYNGSGTIAETLQSILAQTFSDFEIIVQDNASSDGTADVVKSFSDPRIKYFKNEKNLGYAGNLIAGKKNCSGDVLYLMAADDVLLQGALSDTHRAFILNGDIGAVTRPYYWFTKDVGVPVRATLRMNPAQDEVVSIRDDFSRIRCVLDNEVLGQLSGLAFRMKFIDVEFSRDSWISHGYPMLSIFKKHPVVFLRNYQLAVRIGLNETRLSTTYDYSPTRRWVELFEAVMPEPEFRSVRRQCVQEILARNYVGLVQIKNFGSYRSLVQEILCLIEYRWQNVLSPRFWFFSVGTLIVPAALLLPMVDFYKEYLGSRLARNLKITAI